MTPGTPPRGGRVSQRAPIASKGIPPGGAGALFHEGERAIQRRAGAERVAAQMGPNTPPFVPAEFAPFLTRHPFVVVPTQDQRGPARASPIAAGAVFSPAPAPWTTARPCWPACQLPGTR